MRTEQQVMKRGLIVRPNIKVSGRLGTITGMIGILPPTMTSELLRFYLTYWDEVVLLEGTLRFRFSDPLGSDMEKAKQLGRLKYEYCPSFPEGKSDGLGLARFHSRIYGQALAYFNRAEPGYWVMGRASNSTPLRLSPMERQSVIQMGLSNALSVPCREVPIDEVVSFRNEHENKYKSFRRGFERVYQEVLKAEDKKLGQMQGYEQILTSLSSIRDHMVKHGFRPSAFSWNSAWTVSKEILGAAEIGAVAGSPAGPEIALYTSMAAVAAEAAMQINRILASTPANLPESVKDFMYVYDAEQQLSKLDVSAL